jgi:predicted transcriptional regulator
MSSVTTVKVPSDLRDRLATVAAQRETTLAGAIAYALDAADEAEFWRQVADRMSGPAAAAALRPTDGALRDGLDPDEDWSELW